jgi:hypothetical protein
VIAEGKRACGICGSLLSATNECCPVCALRGALSSESTAEPTLLPSQLRFEHYEILTGGDGRPVELGRGAMGVTYKAVDVNLQCPVALKVVNARLIGDESARRRFVREARAAASGRDPNVASVFHLGRSGENYFYAMEFVDGESLDKRIRRSGRLEPSIALSVATRVAAGLEAIQKQNLVHRDIKPSNIMIGSVRSSTNGEINRRSPADYRFARCVAGERSSPTISESSRPYRGHPQDHRSNGFQIAGHPGPIAIDRSGVDP